jgi:LEA14-like dessication related protein
MRKTIAILAICAAGTALIIGCASQGPIVSVQPTVTVSSFESISFSPTLAKYVAKILIHNNAGQDIDFQRTDYAVDLFDTQLFTDSFDGMKRTKANGDQTVTFPFQVAMEDIANQGIDLLSEQGLRVTFRGNVYTAARYGMDPVPFTGTVTVPIPQMPEVTYVGTEGEALSDAWRVNFTIRNPNKFPFTLASVRTTLILNGKKYSLLHTHGATEVKPGETAPVALRMETSPEKALSMALNLATNRDLRFNITGMVTCTTPYGLVLIPLNLDEGLE